MNLRARIKNQKGQGMTEYILIVALIAVFAIGAIKFFGTSTANNFSAAANATNTAVGSATGGGNPSGAVGGVVGAITGGH
jgi:Flp pilus assembly pilin Flp